MKKLFIGVLGIAVLLLAACSPQPLQTIGASKYYVKVTDDGEMFEEAGNKRYAYNYTGYDKDGQALDLSFTAGKQLKQDAFLAIYYKDNQVVTYEEVDFADIPADAQALFGQEE